MSKYLNEQKIKELASNCEAILTSDIKSMILKLRSKHGLNFDCYSHTNANMLWKLSKENLLKDSQLKLRNGKTVEQNLNGKLVIDNCVIEYYITEFNQNIQIYIEDYINDNYQKDYKFLLNFDASELMQTIETIFQTNEISNPPTFTDLLNTSNFSKFFSSRYGIDSADKNEVKRTQRIAKFYNELFEGVNNKVQAFDAVRDYVINGDISQLHGKLFN